MTASMSPTKWLAWTPKGADPRIAAVELPANQAVNRSRYLLALESRLGEMIAALEPEEALAELTAAVEDANGLHEALGRMKPGAWPEFLMTAAEDLREAVTSHLGLQTWPVEVSQPDQKAAQAIKNNGLRIWLGLALPREAA